jgi:transposase
LAWLLDMTRAEKEQFVIRLYKENKSIREIAKLMHMSFRDIGQILNKLKEEKGQQEGDLGERDDVNDTSKSKITQAIKLFSEGKAPVEVVIALDLPADQVQAIYREFWELKGMYKLAQIYEEAKYDLHTLLRLHKVVKDLGMGEQQIINVFELANHNQLEYLQWKVEYLSNEVNLLEEEKANCTKHLLLLNKRRDEYLESMYTYESSLAQKKEELAYMNQEPRMLALNNRINEPIYTDNIYPLPAQIEMRRESLNLRLTRRGVQVEGICSRLYDALLCDR